MSRRKADIHNRGTLYLLPARSTADTMSPPTRRHPHGNESKERVTHKLYLGFETDLLMGTSRSVVRCRRCYAVALVAHLRHTRQTKGTVPSVPNTTMHFIASFNSASIHGKLRDRH